MTYTERTWMVFVGKVANLYDQGLTAEEIAKKLDTSVLIVEKVISDYSLDDEC